MRDIQGATAISRRGLFAAAGAAAAAAGAASVVAHAQEATSGDPFAAVSATFDYGVDKQTEGVKHAPEAPADVRGNIVVFNASSTLQGNGDTIAQTVVERIDDAADVARFNLRDYHIAPVVQHGNVPPVEDVTSDHDAMDLVIPAIHNATGLVFVFPTIYNTIDPRTLTLISRLWQPTWSNPDYELGYQKRVAVIGTCTGSSPDWLTLNVNALLTLPDVLQSVADSRVEIFPGCGTPDTVATTDDYLATVRDCADWVMGR